LHAPPRGSARPAPSPPEMNAAKNSYARLALSVLRFARDTDKQVRSASCKTPGASELPYAAFARSALQLLHFTAGLESKAHILCAGTAPPLHISRRLELRKILRALLQRRGVQFPGAA
jgi:hypothetical protein